MDLDRFTDLDRRITRLFADHGITLLRISIGVVFFWFGVLKFWPGLSPADGLALDTIDRLTFGLLPPTLARLGQWAAFSPFFIFSIYKNQQIQCG